MWRRTFHQTIALLLSSAPAVAGGPEASRAYELAVAADEAGDYATARRKYLEALDHDKDHGRALINLGILEVRERAAEKGLARCKRALEIDARAAKAHYCVGLAHAAAGRNAPAGAAFEKAIELHSADPSPKLELAHIRRKEGKHSEAIELYRAAVRDLPDAPDLHVHLGYCYKASGQWDAAEVEYRKAVQKDPSSFFGHLNLGVVLVRKKKYEDAEKHYRMAADLDPEKPEPQFNLGNLTARTGRFEDAVRYYKRAVELAPNDAEYRLAHARTLWRLGDRDEAAAELSRAKQLKASPEVTSAIQTLSDQLSSQPSAPKPVKLKKTEDPAPTAPKPEPRTPKP